MRFRLVLTAALVTTALSGCGTSNNTTTGAALGVSDSATPTTTSHKPDKTELVAWVDKVCGAAVDSVGPMQQTPTLDQSNLTKFKTQFVDYLTKASQALAKGETDLAAFKDGPHRDSGRYVESITGTITKFKGTMDASLQKVQAANPKKPQEFALVIQGVGFDIQNAGLFNTGILVDKDLADAEKEAPKCQKLKA